MKNPTTVKAFGDRLRALRDEKGLSQQKLADLADLAKLTIQRIEKARMAATIDVMASLANGLGVSLEELVRFTMGVPLPKGKKIERKTDQDENQK